MKSQGLELIAVNLMDDAATIKKYVKEGKFAFPIVMDVQGDHSIATAYGVSAAPTNYILGPDGKIVTALVGFDEESMVAELKKLGFTVKGS